MRRLYAILRAALLIPPALIVALIVCMTSRARTTDRTPEEVAAYLRNCLNKTNGPRDWDDFESAPITDPELETLRLKAIMVGPSAERPDFDKLAVFLQEVEAIVAARTATPGRS